jgi:subtilisin family serine protease
MYIRFGSRKFDQLTKGDEKMRRQPERFQKRYFLSILILLIFSLLSWSVVHSQEIAAVTVEKGHPKIESALFDLQQKYLLHGKDLSLSSSQRRNLRLDNDDKVTVFILPTPGETRDAIDIDTLQTYGGEVLKSGYSVIKARVPIGSLKSIADQVRGIGFIKRPDRPYAGVVSEGVSLTGASLYQASGYAGQNTSVAIIDLEFGRLAEAISAGVLPQIPNAQRIDCTGHDCVTTDFSSEDPEFAHGTAVAEIVHDMAPAAQLYLIKVDDSIDLLNAKDYCIANGIRVINHSVGWFNSNFYDGACWFDNAVCTANHAYKNGILWANSAGNHARMHYGATFSDSDGDRLHNVTASNNFISLYAYAGDPIIALMTWDAWPGTAQDYDLLLFDSSMQLVSSSTNVQNGTQPPEEEVYYVAPTSGTYYLAVRNSSATTNLRFSIFTFYHDLDPYVASSSLLSPSDAAGVMAVAAVNYTNWLTGPQESFSSQGPTTDGRMKPEISGPDGVSSFIYGSFFGTSAASPHVAGAAALILSNNPTFTVAQLWNTLTSSAIDLGASGQDPIFGYGRLNLATIFVDPDSIDFGDVIVGQGVEKTVTIRNVGNPNLVIGVIAGASAPFALRSDSCSERSLPLAGSCTFKVRFSPSSTGSFNNALTIPSNDPFNSVLTVSVKGRGILVINLSSPKDQFPIDPCSFKVPPVFEWEVPVTFPSYELQFSADPNFSLIPVRIKVPGTPVFAMNSVQWKKVLLIPGSGGGAVYWRVVGTSSNGTQSASGKRSILVPAPQPVADPGMSPVSRNDLPTLTWLNQCNSKFRVWFGNDPSFFVRRFVSYSVPDPEVNGGFFSRELSSSKWRGIRMLALDQPGSPIYWYVESWDGLNRKEATEVMFFLLEN